MSRAGFHSQTRPRAPSELGRIGGRFLGLRLALRFAPPQAFYAARLLGGSLRFDSSKQGTRLAL